MLSQDLVPHALSAFPKVILLRASRLSHHRRMKPPTFVAPWAIWQRQGDSEPASAPPHAFHSSPLADPLGQRRRPLPRSDRRSLGCATQTVRMPIRAFSHRHRCLRDAHTDPRRLAPCWTAARAERLRALLHRSPRDFGKPTSLWTLEWSLGSLRRGGSSRGR